MTQTPHEDPGAHPAAKISDAEARTWMMLCHLTSLLALTVIPLAHILGPLIVWLMKKDDHPEIDRHGRESLNFQISWSIWTFVAALVWFLIIPLVIVLVGWLVLVIIASMKAKKGEFYRYPLTIRFF